MANLHAICGLYHEAFTGIKPFGGYIIAEGDKIDGFLTDIHGHSRIEGAMTQEDLEFTKTYDRPGTPINYRFKLDKAGIWKGEYEFSRAGETMGGDRAVCRTHLCFENMTFRLYDSRKNPEEWAKMLLEGMVDEGMLKIVEDPETGQEFVEPGELPEQGIGE